MAINLEKYILIDQHAHSLLKGHLQLDAIAFRQGTLYKSLTPAQSLDIAYSISEDTWNAKEKIQLKIKDIKI